jgi:serine/threonine protein phosphatase PrpC
MNSDAYYEIGTAHVACQDYALAGTFKNMSYGIVSDGCSSAEHSEIGAQILCHVAQYYLTLYYDLFLALDQDALTNLLWNSILKRADEIRKLYPINNSSLQATLLINVMLPKRAFTFVWGDGVIVTIKGEKVEVIEIDYPETNAPFYLVTDVKEHKKKFGEQQVRVKLSILDKSGNVMQEGEPLLYKIDVPFTCSVEGDHRVVLCSDGVTQYLDENMKPIPLMRVIPEIIDYPSTNGVFVQRTMNFLKKDFLKRGWSHSDDIGVACVL